MVFWKKLYLKKIGLNFYNEIAWFFIEYYLEKKRVIEKRNFTKFCSYIFLFQKANFLCSNYSFLFQILFNLDVFSNRIFSGILPSKILVFYAKIISKKIIKISDINFRLYNLHCMLYFFFQQKIINTRVFILK